jgi:hypothetical protein
MTIDKLGKMWSAVADISINKDDEIETAFYCWKKGTYRFDIWHWFDEKLPKGIAEYVI